MTEPRALPRQGNVDPALAADIDATGEIEDKMVDAARDLVENHGYTVGDLVDVLEATIEFPEVDDGS